MRKILATVLSLTLSFSLFAQVGSANDLQSIDLQSMSFFDIMFRNGEINTGIWILILSLSGLGFLLGILAIVASVKTKSRQIPLAVKLLPVGLVFVFLLGLLGMTTGIINSFIFLGHPGRVLFHALAFSISHSLYSLSFSLLASIEYILFFAISLIILHFKNKKIISSALSEKIAAYMTEEYIMQRADRADKRKFKEALSKIQNTPPDTFDKL